MHDKPDQAADRRLLSAISDFVARRTDRELRPFSQALAESGERWLPVAPRSLPASSRLEDLVTSSIGDARILLSCFAAERRSRHWEQAYSKNDHAVSAHMLENYAYTEVVGRQGPCLSPRIRAGIAIYGPGIDYPPHRHQAEEIYLVLAGSATFERGDEGAAERDAGSLIHHTPQMAHALRTGDRSLAILYLWLGGNLREKPTFG